MLACFVSVGFKATPSFGNTASNISILVYGMWSSTQVANMVFWQILTCHPFRGEDAFREPIELALFPSWLWISCLKTMEKRKLLAGTIMNSKHSSGCCLLFSLLTTMGNWTHKIDLSKTGSPLTLSLAGKKNWTLSRVSPCAILSLWWEVHLRITNGLCTMHVLWSRNSAKSGNARSTKSFFENGPTGKEAGYPNQFLMLIILHACGMNSSLFIFFGHRRHQASKAQANFWSRTMSRFVRRNGDHLQSPQSLCLSQRAVIDAIVIGGSLVYILFHNPHHLYL